MRRAAVLACVCALWAAHEATAGPQPVTRQARACLAWDKEIHRMLGWSELYDLHSAGLRDGIRAETDRLRDKCVRDISMASLNRYVMLMKMLYDDEADEFESFD